jgi:hypothetical protein
VNRRATGGRIHGRRTHIPEGRAGLGYLAVTSSNRIRSGIVMICSPKSGPSGIGVFRYVLPWLGGAEDDERLKVLGRAEGVRFEAGRQYYS